MEAFVFVIFIAAIYFIPSIVAISRDHPSKGAVIILNILLGWTFIGWVVAIVWSFTNPNQVVVQSNQQSNTTDELEKLVSLKEKGILTEEEFARKKAQILR
jgi:cytochrome c biogenesis protein CcdA